MFRRRYFLFLSFPSTSFKLETAVSFVEAFTLVQSSLNSVKVKNNNIQDEWEQSKPDEFNKWNDDQNKSIENSSNDITYGKATCPLCRKKYIR